MLKKLKSLIALAFVLGTTILAPATYANTTDSSKLVEITNRMWTQVDVDGWYGGQCWDLTNFYLILQGSQGISGGTGQAGYIGHHYQSQLEAEGFYVKLNPELSELQAGDIVNITPGIGFSDPYYGHTAIIKAVNPDGSFTTLEQNSEYGQIVAEYTRFYQPGEVASKVSKLLPEPKVEVKEEKKAQIAKKEKVSFSKEYLKIKELQNIDKKVISIN